MSKSPLVLLPTRRRHRRRRRRARLPVLVLVLIALGALGWVCYRALGERARGPVELGDP